MTNIPDRIYLQWYEDDDGTLESLNETTWCVDKINSDDVEYVRAIDADQRATVAEAQRDDALQRLAAAEELLRSLCDAAECFLSSEIVDETSGTIPLMDRLGRAIEAARAAGGNHD